MIVKRKEFLEESKEVGYVECIYDSSNILKTTYFPKKDRLFIYFKRGGTYSYGNVNNKLYEEFEKSDSQGKFFQVNIRNNSKDFPYRKEFNLTPSEINDCELLIENFKKNNKNNV